MYFFFRTILIHSLSLSPSISISSPLFTSLSIGHSLAFSALQFWLDFVWYDKKLTNQTRSKGSNNTKKQLRLLQISFGQRLDDTCTMPMLCVQRCFFNSVSVRRVFGHCYCAIIFDIDVFCSVENTVKMHTYLMYEWA